MFMRFWFVDYYEGFELPDEPKYARVRRWKDACVTHPAAQQVTREEIIASITTTRATPVTAGFVLGRRVSLVRLRAPLVEASVAATRQVRAGRHGRMELRLVQIPTLAPSAAPYTTRDPSRGRTRRDSPGFEWPTDIEKCSAYDAPALR